MSIITDYQISFGIRKVHNKDFKLISSISPTLDSLFFEFRNVIDCDDLLEVINLRIANPPQSQDFLYTTQGLQMMKIDYSVTKMYHDVEEYEANPNMSANYTLPTADFKEIVKAWRNFLNDKS